MEESRQESERHFAAQRYRKIALPFSIRRRNSVFPLAPELAHGEYLVRLNNDVVVSDAWLDQLVALASAQSRATGDLEQEAPVEIRLAAKCAESTETNEQNGEPAIFDFNEVIAERRRASAPEAELVNVVASDSDCPVSPALLAQCPPPLTPPWQGGESFCRAHRRSERGAAALAAGMMHRRAPRSTRRWRASLSRPVRPAPPPHHSRRRRPPRDART